MVGCKNKNVSVALIVAMAQNRVIGRENELPWHLPNDLKYFKAKTSGKPIIMGRKTFESIGRALPNRTNIVVTSNKSFKSEGVMVVHNVKDAVAEGKKVALNDDVSEVMVIGGAQLYVEMLPEVKRLYITQVHEQVPGDTFFPDIDLNQWNQVSCENFSSDETNAYEHSFVIYERR